MRKVFFSLFAALTIICSIAAQDVVLEKVENGHRVEIYAVNNTQVAQEVTLDLTLKEVAADVDLPAVEVVPAEAKVLMATLTPEPLKAWSYKTRYKYEEYVVEKPAPHVAVEAGPANDIPPSTSSEPTISSQPETRPFEAGPDIDDADPTTEAGYDSEQYAPDDPRIESARMTVGQAQEKQMSTEDEERVMGPPLSTDDMPIPAKYYDQPTEDIGTAAGDANVFEIPAESVMTIGEVEKVVVYGQPGCPRCAMAKAYFDDNEIAFEYYDITQDQVAKDQMTSRLFQSGFEGGQFIMPVIYVDEMAHYSIKDLEGFLDGLTTRE